MADVMGEEEETNEVRSQAAGLFNGILKSLATDPEGRVARWLFEQQVGLTERELPPDADELRIRCLVSWRLIVLLAKFASDTVREAKEQGATLSQDPSTFDSPYDLFMEIEGIDAPLDATEGEPEDPPSSLSDVP